MQSLIDLMQEMASEAISKAFPCLEENTLYQAEISPSTQPQFGHYQCNSALKIAKTIQVNPREVAEAIVLHFPRKTINESQIISKIEIAGPGFINIFLDKVYLAEEIKSVFTDTRLGVPALKKKQKVIVEFSSPNIAKEMHVGHIRSTIIGDCLARVMEFLGHDVLRLNHIGDWGTQFGMLIAHMYDHHADVLNGAIESDLLSLMQWYKESKTRFDLEPEFKKRAQLQVVALQGGDPASINAWKTICDISRKGFQEIYDLLDVKLIERGESFYNPYLPEVIKDLERKQLITISDGAKCVFMEGFVSREGDRLPMIIQKSDGGYNYDTTDMAAIRHRVLVEKADRIIILTDAGQSLHFQMVFKAAYMAGYYDPKDVQLDHVAFGVVLGADGKKFKTRSGETEKLIDLLLAAVTKARDLLEERVESASDAELDQMANILGIDAVKYADLSCHRIKDYVFSYDRMLRFEGNTAAYLLYSYVRVQGIKRKIGKDPQALIDKTTIMLEHPTELALAVHIRQFGEAISHVEKELLPNRLTDYLYELAEKFHAFFRDCRVEGDPMEESRLLLAEVTGRVLKQGLELLGLKTLERM
ncbi:MAG: arginine--tRNA ligase [Anaplasmataceae bacterium]|nr:arginine--tRNA ligase [Anaplasmataceae bacterium]